MSIGPDLIFNEIDLSLFLTEINLNKLTSSVIVTGDSRGSIRFYDEQLKLLYWVHGFTPDGVRSLSFNVEPRQYRVYDNPACQMERSKLSGVIE